jgi:hypothetical protein
MISIEMQSVRAIALVGTLGVKVQPGQITFMRLRQDKHAAIALQAASDGDGLDAKKRAFAAKESQKLDQDFIGCKQRRSVVCAIKYDHPLMSGVIGIEQGYPVEGIREDWLH